MRDFDHMTGQSILEMLAALKPPYTKKKTDFLIGLRFIYNPPPSRYARPHAQETFTITDYNTRTHRILYRYDGAIEEEPWITTGHINLDSFLYEAIAGIRVPLD